MLNQNLKHIKNNIHADQCLIGLDVSKNNIGIAKSDTRLRIAFPFKTIKRRSFNNDIKELSQLVKQENIFAFIVGFPYDGNGSENRRTQSVRDFSKMLEKHINIPIFFQDERFSTKVIKINNKRNKNSCLDEQAAAWFLQIFLNKLDLI